MLCNSCPPFGGARILSLAALHWPLSASACAFYETLTVSCRGLILQSCCFFFPHDAKSYEYRHSSHMPLCTSLPAVTCEGICTKFSVALFPELGVPRHLRPPCPRETRLRPCRRCPLVPWLYLPWNKKVKTELEMQNWRQSCVYLLHILFWWSILWTFWIWSLTRKC